MIQKKRKKKASKKNKEKIQDDLQVYLGGEDKEASEDFGFEILIEEIKYGECTVKEDSELFVANIVGDTSLLFALCLFRLSGADDPMTLLLLLCVDADVEKDEVEKWMRKRNEKTKMMNKSLSNIYICIYTYVYICVYVCTRTIFAAT